MSNENREVLDELQEMLEEPTPSEEEEVSEETPVEEQPESQHEESSQEEEETSEAPETSEEEEDELTALRKQNELLLQRVGELSRQVKPEQEQPTEEPIDVSDESLFEGFKFEEIVESEESFKKFLSGFAKKVVATAEERLLRKLPSTVSKLTQEQLEAKQTAEAFYQKHPQLSAVRPFVAKVVSVVASENPGWTLDQVLEESAKRAYASLGLKQKVGSVSPKKPAFAGPAKRGVQPEAKTRLERELEELMNLE
jgi:cobalamin biosynthesis protein CobT